MNDRLSGKVILERIHKVNPKFRAARNFKSDDLFRQELLSYQKYLVRNGIRTISLPAIANWFKPDSDGPQRVAALQFLHDYLRVCARDRKLGAQSQPIVALADELSEHLSELDFFSEQKAPEKAVSAVAPPHRPSVDQKAILNGDALERLLAMDGTYQVIRPFRSKKSYYALEALAVETHEERGGADFLMYSHNQPVDGFLYNGEMHSSGRYCFGWAQRRDEEDATQRTYRCVTLFVAHRKLAYGYAPHPCLSGIMIRGVKGAETNGLPSVAIPFVAIRSSNKADNLRTPRFTQIPAQLDRLNPGSHILLGRIDQRNKSLFRFCHRLFSSLRNELFNGLVLQTVRPERIEAAICRAAKSEYDYFAAWQDAVKDHLASLDSR